MCYQSIKNVYYYIKTKSCRISRFIKLIRSFLQFIDIFLLYLPKLTVGLFTIKIIRLSKYSSFIKCTTDQIKSMRTEKMIHESYPKSISDVLQFITYVHFDNMFLHVTTNTLFSNNMLNFDRFHSLFFQ